jgi:hypothetical protein
MSRHSEPDVVIANPASSAVTVDPGFRLLTMPDPDEQRQIVMELEAEACVEENPLVYTVSRSWYSRWRLYVGLLAVTGGPETNHSASGNDVVDYHEYPGQRSAPDYPGNSSGGTVESSPRTYRRQQQPTGDGIAAEAVTSQPELPGPIEMELFRNDDNVSIYEKVIVA